MSECVVCRIDLLDMEESSMSKANAGQRSNNSPIMFGDVNGLDHDPLSPNGSSGNVGGASRGRSRVWDRFVIAVGGKKVILKCLKNCCDFVQVNC